MSRTPLNNTKLLLKKELNKKYTTLEQSYLNRFLGPALNYLTPYVEELRIKVINNKEMEDEYLERVIDYLYTSHLPMVMADYFRKQLNLLPDTHITLTQDERLLTIEALQQAKGNPLKEKVLNSLEHTDIFNVLSSRFNKEEALKIFFKIINQIEASWSLLGEEYAPYSRWIITQAIPNQFIERGKIDFFPLFGEKAIELQPLIQNSKRVSKEIIKTKVVPKVGLKLDDTTITPFQRNLLISKNNIFVLKDSGELIQDHFKIVRLAET